MTDDEIVEHHDILTLRAADETITALVKPNGDVEYPNGHSAAEAAEAFWAGFIEHVAPTGDLLTLSAADGHVLVVIHRDRSVEYGHDAEGRPYSPPDSATDLWRELARAAPTGGVG